MLTLDNLTTELADNTELFEMSKEEGDDDGLITIETETAKLAVRGSGFLNDGDLVRVVETAADAVKKGSDR
mgnify:CR=1 FL=1